jgi:hypothetical protein
MFLIRKPFVCVIEPIVQMHDLYLKSFWDCVFLYKNLKKNNLESFGAFTTKFV